MVGVRTVAGRGRRQEGHRLLTQSHPPEFTVRQSAAGSKAGRGLGEAVLRLRACAMAFRAGPLALQGPQEQTRREAPRRRPEPEREAKRSRSSCCLPDSGTVRGQSAHLAGCPPAWTVPEEQGKPPDFPGVPFPPVPTEQVMETPSWQRLSCFARSALVPS